MNRKSIFDLLSDSTNLNIVNEYERLYKLFLKQPVFFDYGEPYTIPRLLDSNIEEWKYRNICTSFEEVIDTIGLKPVTTMQESIKDLLLLIELILNLETFRNNIVNEKISESVENYGYNDEYIVSNILFENSRRLLEMIGYKECNEFDRIILVLNDVDTIVTALDIEDDDLAKYLIEYIDFRNENDLEFKRKILLFIADYLEPLKNKIPNDDLKNSLFNLFNNFNIRHNNKKGSKKNDIAASLTNDQQLVWYDRTFNLSLLAIRLIEFKNSKIIYDEIHK